MEQLDIALACIGLTVIVVGPFTGPPLAQHCPGDTRKLVCQRHDPHIALNTPGQHRSEPLPDWRVTLTERVHCRSSAVNQQGPQIGVAALCYPKQARF